MNDFGTATLDCSTISSDCRSPLAAFCFALALAFSFSGAPYRSGKAGRYNPQGGAHECATFL
ncbi:hypothetical protein EIQ25_17985 [Xanthomonas campestris pv. campestris]